MWLKPILYRGTRAKAESREPRAESREPVLMHIPRPPHRWNVTPTQAIAIQKRLAPRVVQRGPIGHIRYVAGIDAAFPGGDTCLAAAVVWDVRQGEIVQTRHAVRPLRFPYVPGLLAFREAPAILAALRKLDPPVNALMCDGHAWPIRAASAWRAISVCSATCPASAARRAGSWANMTCPRRGAARGRRFDIGAPSWARCSERRRARIRSTSASGTAWTFAEPRRSS